MQKTDEKIFHLSVIIDHYHSHKAFKEYGCFKLFFVLFSVHAGLICHVEDIALLVPSHQDLKQSIKAKDVPLLEGTIRLDARFSSEWISDLSRAGFPSFSGISDLECLHNLFGELTLQEAHFMHETDLQSLTCKFSTSDNR